MTFVLLGILNAQAAGVAAEPAFDLLETTTLGTATSSVTFSGLGSYTDYKHLQVRMIVQSDRGAASDSFELTFNSDTGSNYSWHRLFGNGSSVVSGALTNQSHIYFANVLTATDVYTASILDILDFSSSSKNTTIRALTGSSSRIGLHSGLYFQTSAITSFTIVPTNSNITAGSRFSLYGIKAGA